MPEGDTVFRTAAALRDALEGRVLTRCDVRVPQHATVDLTGHTVDEVLSRGKHLFIRVGPVSIHSHLKMDGSWQIGRVRAADHKIRIVLGVDGSTAYGVDLGVLEILPRADDLEAVAHLGPTCWAPDWSAPTAAANLVADPDRAGRGVAGSTGDGRVGNVYANELCFVFGRLPTAAVSTLPTRCASSPGPNRCCGPTGYASAGPQPVTPGAAANCGSTDAPASRTGGAVHPSGPTTPDRGSPTGVRRVSAKCSR